MRLRVVASLGVLLGGACSRAHPLGDAATGDAPRAGGDAGRIADAAGSGSSAIDAAIVPGIDAGTTIDAKVGAIDAAGGGVITGGPCLSGTPGATAYRVRWANAGGTAQVVHEGNGLPDHSRDHAAAYGYQIGFTPAFVDPFLGEGGLQLDGSDFVDLELTTAGVAHIDAATLSIYGRSFNTTTSGSFEWQTFDGVGGSPTNSVSNVAPYAWYSADMTTEISAADPNVLIRIKAGPSSGVLVVNRIELCVVAH